MGDSNIWSIDSTQRHILFTIIKGIRETCKQDSFKLEGEVEIDENYIGGKEGNKHNSKRLEAQSANLLYLK